jgi:hypothetical protein
MQATTPRQINVPLNEEITRDYAVLKLLGKGGIGEVYRVPAVSGRDSRLAASLSARRRDASHLLFLSSPPHSIFFVEVSDERFASRRSGQTPGPL